MKRILCLVLTLAMLVSSFAFQAVFAADDIEVLVNGKNLTMDQPPVLVNDRTLVPVRAIFEALGAKVDWNNDTNTATGVLGGTTVEIQIENTVAKVNGKDVTLDVPAKLISDRTLVPVRFISESLGAKVDWDNNTQTVIITTQKSNVRTFDNETDFVIGKTTENVVYSNEFDCLVGGSGGSQLVLSISDEEDHTFGNGKSLKMENKALRQSRIKLFNTFGNNALTKDMSGKTYRISFWAKSKVDGEVVTGLLAASHIDSMDQKYEMLYYKEGAMNTKASTTKEIKANEWTHIEYDYKLDDKNVGDFQIGLLSIQIGNIDTLYIDDISVEEVKDSTGKIEETKDTKDTTAGIPNVLANPTDHRPVPTNFEKSNRIDDLYYFPMPEAGDVAYSKLSGGVKVLGENDLFDTRFTTEGIPGYGTYEKTEISDGDGFSKVLRFNVTKVPQATWQMNFRIYPEYFENGDYEDNSIFLIKAKIRLVSGGDFDTKMGAFEISFLNTKKREGGGRARGLASEKWSTLYVPFQTTHEYCKGGVDIGFNPGIYNQVIEIGGFEVINYGTKYKITDMPSSYGSYEGCEEDAQWRKDALARIEKIRKGDIKVIVKDKDGNAVPNASVKLDMYEHEFMLSLAGSTSTAKNDWIWDENYRKSIVENFNSLGSEGSLHRMYENQDDQPSYKEISQIFKWGKANGVGKAIKGHALLWDTEPGENVPNLAVYEKTKIGPYLSVLNDRQALDKKVKEHFEWIGKNLTDVTHWDVTNEDSSRMATGMNTIKKVYGKEVLVNWYKYAREAIPYAKLLLTDGWSAPSTALWKETEGPFFEWAYKNLDFDIVGHQGHTGYTTKPEDIVKTLDELSKAGKPIHITEFDTGTIGEDQNYQANLVRDALIAYFACENVEYIQLWGHRDWSSKTKSDRILYENDWTLKPSGKVYQDLFYNKWWTKESGTTGADGSFATRGYYGDYDITVTTADGKTKTVSVPCHKGADNTITITIE